MTAIRKSYAQRGFTLVEILIVVIILGILAAIVIPQFTNASTEARESNVRSQLQTLRSQIELYKLQHKDQAPDLIAGGTGGTEWEVFLMYSDIDGNTQATKDDTFCYGPYMNSAPVNPLTGLSKLADTPGADLGWVYDKDDNGKISAMSGKLANSPVYDETN